MPLDVVVLDDDADHLPQRRHLSTPQKTNLAASNYLTHHHPAIFEETRSSQWIVLYHSVLPKEDMRRLLLKLLQRAILSLLAVWEATCNPIWARDFINSSKLKTLSFLYGSINSLSNYSRMKRLQRNNRMSPDNFRSGEKRLGMNLSLIFLINSAFFWGIYPFALFI